MASMSDNETANLGSTWELDQNLDEPMDDETGQLKNMNREKKFSLILAFQSLGIVFGDLGTSPLYVFYNIFPHGFDDEEGLLYNFLASPNGSMPSSE